MGKDAKGHGSTKRYDVTGSDGRKFVSTAASVSAANSRHPGAKSVVLKTTKKDAERQRKAAVKAASKRGW